MKAFISYTTECENFAQRIKETLESQNIQVWLSRESISPGERWSDSISRAIESSDIFFPIFSKTSSTNVISEIALALSFQKEGKIKRIIPIIAEKNAEIPIFLKEIQYVDLSDKDNYQRNLEQLINYLKTYVPSAQPTQEAELKTMQRYLDSDIKALKSEMLESERKRYRFITMITTFLSTFVITLSAIFAIFFIVNEQGKWPTYMLVIFVIIVFVLFIAIMILLHRSRKFKSR